MNVDLTPEQEAQLSQIAAHSGKDANQLLKDAALRLLENDSQFRAAVRKGIAAADRGNFVDDAEMDARIERILSS